MRMENPLLINLSLAQDLTFTNEAIATNGLQDYSVFVKCDFKIWVIKLTPLLLTIILSMAVQTKNIYCLLTSSP